MVLYLLAILFVAGLYFGIILILGKKEIEGATVCILCLAGFLMAVIAGPNSLPSERGHWDNSSYKRIKSIKSCIK